MKKYLTSLAIVAALAFATPFAACASGPPDVVLTGMNTPVDQVSVVDTVLAQADYVVQAVGYHATQVVLATQDDRRNDDPARASVPQLIGDVPVPTASPPAPPLRI